MGQSDIVIVRKSFGQFAAGVVLSVLVPAGMILTIALLFVIYASIGVAILPICIARPISNFICDHGAVWRTLLLALGLSSFVKNVRLHCSLPWTTTLSIRQSAILVTDWKFITRPPVPFDEVLSVVLVDAGHTLMGRNWDEHVCWRLEIQTASKGCQKIPIYESWDKLGSVSFDILQRGIAVAGLLGVKFETGTFVTRDSLAKAQSRNQQARLTTI